MKFNNNFSRLPASYVFASLAAKKALAKKKWGDELIDLGIGDVKLPLFGCVKDEMQKAAEELTKTDKFKGYPPSAGYDFLRNLIAEDYKKSGINITPDEIFVNDGAKGELFSLNALLDGKSRILFPVPCYPAGIESAILFGNEPIFLKADENQSFYPPFSARYDAIYLCSPSNPSGKAFNRQELEMWINYAISTNAAIFFDGAYSDYVSDGGVKSIFEIEGAKRCAAELRSFSKGYGFTGLRLGYIVIPKEQPELNKLRARLSGCLHNGVSYVTQRGGAACFSEEGQAEMKKRVNYYKTNAEIIRRSFEKTGVKCLPGNDSPYVYAKCPEGYTDETFCSFLSDKAGVITTPGKGFYEENGEFFRASAFLFRDDALKAADRISSLGQDISRSGHPG